jgi:hypothetical protein
MQTKVAAPFFLFTIILFSLASQGQTAKKPALALETTPYFEKPEPGLLPKGFLEKRDTCATDSMSVDSTGAAWFRIQVKNAFGWAPARAMRFVSDIPPDFFSQEAMGVEDKKRRADLVKSHSDWPLRIKKAVRAGQVCLDMSEDQLLASWGEPLEKKKMFMLGAGEFVCCIYKGSEKGALLVSLQNNRVTGWSIEDK